MPDLSKWTIADLIGRMPVSAWWWAGGIIFAVFWAGFELARWVQSRKLENCESDLSLERTKPKLSITLGAADRDVGDVAHLLRFSFSKSEYIYPEILEELEGWISDGLPVYAAVDLEGAMRCNRFFRPPEARQPPDSNGWVSVVKEEQIAKLRKPFYMYKFIGVTPSGTHLVQTASSGGGSGVFCRILFMRFQIDEVLTGSLDVSETRRRILLRCIGDRALGDRYDGQVSYSNGILTIGKGTRIDIGRQPVEETTLRID